MDNLIFWNVRGTVARDFFQNIRALCIRKRPSLLLLAETKCDSADRFKCLNRLGFDGLSCVPSVGRSGGIIAAWRTDLLDVAVLKGERRYIHLKCCDVGNRCFLLTVVYAIPEIAMKNVLWQDIRNFASAIIEPWVLVGDFNDVVSLRRRRCEVGLTLVV
ncbi:hypothetical protein K1719_011077 [Acacia pycnantha]|nr:hypothetical protein K1719_011077 [Acacia pycnantha]